MLCAVPARAERLHALAMQGDPRYPASYQHFDYVNPSAPKGGHLKTSKNGSFDNLNNHIIIGTNADGLEFLNDKLMQRAWNEPFTLYGLVAESIEITPDRSVITFHLRKEARFHDGQPMTAADVKYSYEMYRAHGHPVRRRVYGLIRQVEVLSPQDIRFTFGDGYDRESALILAMMPVLPKHYWEKHDLTKTTLDAPLGSGPYKVKSVEPGRRVVYERVRDYWAKDLPMNAGLYNFDTITYSYYRDDDIALEAFKAGDYNLRHEYNISKWKTGYDFKALAEKRVVKKEFIHHRPEWLRAMIFNTRREQFSDMRVREALGLMFNFDWINNNMFFGSFKRIDSVFSNSELAARGKPEGEELAQLMKYQDSLPTKVFGEMWQPPSDDMRSNQRRAMQLLKDAGWIYRDQQLVNGKTGEVFTFEILLNGRSEEKVALEFARALKKIGVVVSVRTVDSAQFTGRLDGYDYDVVLYRWINSLSPGSEQLNYWGSEAANNNGARNYAGIQSAAIDGLAASIPQAFTYKDLVARTRALDRAIMWGHYMIPMYYLGRDLISFEAGFQYPEAIPAYGILTDTWWWKEAR